MPTKNQRINNEAHADLPHESAYDSGGVRDDRMESRPERAQRAHRNPKRKRGGHAPISMSVFDATAVTRQLSSATGCRGRIMDSLADASGYDAMPSASQAQDQLKFLARRTNDHRSRGARQNLSRRP
jgi:hypothetical protein